MVAPLVAVLAVGGGVAWVAAQPEVAPPIPTNTSGSGSPKGPMQPSSSVLSPKKWATMNMITAGYGARPQVGGSSSYSPSPVSSNTPSSSVGLLSQAFGTGAAEKLRVVNQYAGAVYDKMESAARRAGAAKLNSALGLDPPIKEDASWKDIAAAVGAAGGAALGAYLGGPIGAKIGAMVGAYLGVKLEEFMSKHVDEIKDWFKGKYAAIESFFAELDASDYVSGAAIQNAADEVSQWFSDTF